ncbi:70-kilodalton heat shock protein [Gryganskiella cystojenkinii]|nr:70-kilodalton heat shock protein [Gryganskiella cystojenkinii]
MNANASPSTGTGINLGSSNAYIAVCQDDIVEVLPNNQGDLATPTYVAFTDSRCLIGKPAQDQQILNPTNTVFNMKLLKGRQFDDLNDIQSDLPFKIVENHNNNKSQVQVQLQGKTVEFSPEEIEAMVLTKLKETATSYLEQDSPDAVITVPAYFNDAQRQATKDAGRMAGLNVLRVINESTSACIAYKLDNSTIEEERTVIVFHLGGRTLTITHLTIEEGIFEIQNTTYDTHLGGEDFTDRLTDHFVQEINTGLGKDILSDSRALHRLRTACETAKCDLSSLTETEIEIKSLFEGIDFKVTVTKSLFDKLAKDLIVRIEDHLERFLQDFKLDKDVVHGVVLSGGSTRLLKIRSMLSKVFNNGPDIYSSIKPEEVIARGAAIQAHILTHQPPMHTMFCIFDVTPLTLGIETAGGVMTPVTRRNTTIPSRKTQMFSTATDNQTSALIQIYDGERARTRDNHWLGEFEILGISPAPRGVPQIEVVFDLNMDGCLTVSATDKQRRRNNTRQIMIRNNVAGEGRGHSAAEIEAMIVDAEQHREEDDLFRLQIAGQTAVQVAGTADGDGRGPCRDVILLPPPSDDGFFEPEDEPENQEIE